MQSYFRRQIAITNEHGSWVFLLSPLLIGLCAGNRLTTASIYLIAAALAGFLIRHPLVIAVKTKSGRRKRKDLPAAIFWISVYGTVGSLMVAGLLFTGFGYVLYLVIPGIPVFTWHLILVSRRAERRQLGIELVASGVLALTAPAAYWIGVGEPLSTGWLLWGLVWLQSAASIVYAYLRLEQRELRDLHGLRSRLSLGRRAILYTSFNLGLTIVLSTATFLPPWIFLPFAIQWIETLWGSLIRPAVGVKPTLIGLRQLAISTIFTLIFIITWRMG